MPFVSPGIVENVGTLARPVIGGEKLEEREHFNFYSLRTFGMAQPEVVC